MQYQELQSTLKNYPVFNLNDIRKIDPHFYRSRLNEWQSKKYIKKIRRGFYIFSDLDLNEKALFLIANKIYSPSYISFEMALSYYGLIPEGVYTLTSATTLKTAVFYTEIGNFSYRKIKSDLMFGYKLETHDNQIYKIAELEKAFLDYLYLNPKIANYEDFIEWRFNSENFFSQVDFIKLRRYAVVYKNKSLIIRLEKLLQFMRESK